MKHKVETNNDEEVEFSKYMLKGLLPHLRRLDEEQMIEKEREAKIQGIPLLSAIIFSFIYFSFYNLIFGCELQASHSQS